MRLVGAPELMVRLPLLLQGMMQGLLGAMLAIWRPDRLLRDRRPAPRAARPSDARPRAADLPAAPQRRRAHAGRHGARRVRRLAGAGPARAVSRGPASRWRSPSGPPWSWPRSRAGQAPRRGEDSIQAEQRKLQQTEKQLREERKKAAEARARETSVLAELEEIDQRLADKQREIARLDAPHQARGQRRAIAPRARSGSSRRSARGSRTRWPGACARCTRCTPRAAPCRCCSPGTIPVARGGRAAPPAAWRRWTLVSFKSIVGRRTGSRTAAVGKRPGSAIWRAFAPTRNVSRPRSMQTPPSAGFSSPRSGTSVPTTSAWSASSPRRPGASRRSSGTCRPSSVGWPRSRPRKPGTEPRPQWGSATLRGRLPWPTEGRVVSAFGAQVHPRFGTRTFRNGVDIEAGEGRDVGAVFGGHVVYTGWFKGYGNLIILDHDNEYYTLYAHVADILVKEGDDVRQGQRIGTVGDTGSLEGPRLYFEVRYQGKPQDPEQWLRQAGLKDAAKDAVGGLHEEGVRDRLAARRADAVAGRLRRQQGHGQRRDLRAAPALHRGAVDRAEPVRRRGAARRS